MLAPSPSFPSVVLLDLGVPAMGGDEWVPILRSKYPGVRILLSSGYPEQEARRISPNDSIAGSSKNRTMVSG